jgi:hypothetical protein
MHRVLRLSLLCVGITSSFACASLLATACGDSDSPPAADAAAPDATGGDAPTSDGNAAPDAQEAGGETGSGGDAAGGNDAAQGNDAGQGGDASDGGQAGDASDGGHGGDAGDAGDAGQSDAGQSDAGDAATNVDAGTVTFVPGVVVSTLAGSDVAGEQDGTGAGAQFTNPTGIALDGRGNLVVTDYDGNSVRYVTPAGVVTTIAAGSADAGTQFVGPFAAVVATDGTFYVETDFNSAGVKNAASGSIWRVTPVDGGVAVPALVAQGFGRPRGLSPIPAGKLFVSDSPTRR